MFSDGRTGPSKLVPATRLPGGWSVKYSTWLKIAVSVGLLGWLLAGVDLPQLRTLLTGIPAGEGLVVVVLCAAAWLVNAAKWKILLAGPSFGNLFALTMIGQFYALVLPGQIAGEAVKAWKLIGRRTAETATIVASVLMDRLTGVAALLWVGFIGASFSSAESGGAWTAAFGLLILGLGLAAYLVRLGPCSAWCRRVLSAIGNRNPFAASFTVTLMNCIDAWIEILRSPVRLLKALVLGGVFQCLAVLILQRIAAAIGVQVAFVDWCWIFAAVSLLLLLPITIGGIGLREGALVTLLAGFGVTAEKALACSLALFGLQLLAAGAGAVMDLGLLVRRPSKR
jgi:hypothetical protein